MRRRLSTVELMLLVTIGLWALNLTVTRYILTHGLEPLTYSTLRYGLAAAIFACIVLLVEGSLKLARRDLLHAIATGLVLYVNQVAFVYALRETSASVIGLILGATPIFVALLGIGLRAERLPQRFWVGAALSFAGVAFVALGTGGEVAGDATGVLLGIFTAATWGAYSVLITPLMQRYSATRISAVVLGASWVPVALTGLPQTMRQDWSLDWSVWALLLFATLGPLVLTNVLWFRSLDRIGPARATLAANLQPFVAAVIAVVLLSETVTAVQLAGGALIAAGILAARRRRSVVPAD